MNDDLSPKNALTDPNAADAEIAEALFGDLGDGIEFELDPTVDLAGAGDHGIAAMQETFLDLVRHSLNPIARYMKALQTGEDAKEIYEISELVVTPLIAKVDETGLTGHAEDLTFFRSLLLLAVGETDPHAKTKMKEIVFEGFAHVKRRFDLRCRGYRMAVRNLVELYRALKGIDALEPQDVRRLFAIGIPSLSWFRKMKTSELAQLSGVDAAKIARVKDIASHNLSALRFAAAEWTRAPAPGAREPINGLPELPPALPPRDYEDTF